MEVSIICKKYTASHGLPFVRAFQNFFLTSGCRFPLSRITPVKGRKTTTRLRGCEGR